MITKIYLIRHAAAEGNTFRVAHGQYNSNLTPMGYRQLWYLRKRFENIHLDAVYGSDLFRTQATASALYQPRGLDFRPMPLLREVKLGDWEKRTWGEIQRLDINTYINFNTRPDLWRVDGAETFAQVRDRTVEGVRQIAQEFPGGTVAAASHGAALRTLLGTLEGLTLEEIGRTSHGDNTAVSLLEVDGDDIRVVFRDDASLVPPDKATFRKQSWYKNDKATEPGLWFRTLQETEDFKRVEAMLDEERAGQGEFVLEPGRLRIAQLALLPPYQHKRYGVQILGQAVQFARDMGREDVVLTCSQDVAGFFAQYGFIPVREVDGSVDMTLDIRLTIREIPEP